MASPSVGIPLVRLRLSWLVFASLLTAAPVAGQPWVTRHQDALWVGTFVDQPVTAHTALWFDGSWRRMDFGAEPQQLLLRPGVQVTLAPGVRVAAGYAYVATAPYGSLPAANPTREQRTWQQLSLSHKAGRFAVSHRYRLEQRWISPLIRLNGDVEDPFLGPASYQNRFRYLGRGQTELPALRLGGRPWIGYVWDELLMPIGGPTQSFTIGQNRASAGVGVPLSATTRVEVGYMNLYNAFAARRANEVNHTLWVSWHYTGRGR
jgi:hypothetical protein